jgi:hypothetical protein
MQMLLAAVDVLLTHAVLLLLLLQSWHELEGMRPAESRCVHCITFSAMYSHLDSPV